MYPDLWSFHLSTKTNHNHSLGSKSSFTVSNNMLLELLSKEKNTPVFLQKNMKQFTDPRSSKVIFNAFCSGSITASNYSVVENFPFFAIFNEWTWCTDTTFIGNINNLRWNIWFGWNNSFICSPLFVSSHIVVSLWQIMQHIAISLWQVLQHIAFSAMIASYQ